MGISPLQQEIFALILLATFAYSSQQANTNRKLLSLFKLRNMRQQSRNKIIYTHQAQKSSKKRVAGCCASSIKSSDHIQKKVPTTFFWENGNERNNKKSNFSEDFLIQFLKDFVLQSKR